MARRYEGVDIPGVRSRGLVTYPQRIAKLSSRLRCANQRTTTGKARRGGSPERRGGRGEASGAAAFDQLEASFEGDALEGELRALREEYSAHAAPTSEAEERDGFFRFERPRSYGRN